MHLSKLFLFLIFIFLIISPACSIELEEHDFDGFFQMDVPVNDSFVKDSILIDPDIYGTVIFHDLTNEITVTHFYRCNNETYVNDTLDNLAINPDIEIYRDGDYNFIKANDANATLYQKGNKVIMISSSSLDFDTLKLMVDSVEFKN